MFNGSNCDRKSQFSGTLNIFLSVSQLSFPSTLFFRPCTSTLQVCFFSLQPNSFSYLCLGFVSRSRSFSIFLSFSSFFSFQFYSQGFLRQPYYFSLLSPGFVYPSDPYSVYYHCLSFLCPSSFSILSLFSLSQLLLYPFSLFSVLAPSLSFLYFFLFVPIFLIYSHINPGSISPS